MRIIKKFAIGKDDGHGDAIFFKGLRGAGSPWDITSHRPDRPLTPKYGNLDDARLFITEKAADDFIEAHGLKDSWPVEIQVVVGL